MYQENLNTTTFIYYKLLGVPKNATHAEIKKKYYDLSKKLHPDKNPDDPKATENFQKLCEAYKILSDPEKKKVYDKDQEAAEYYYWCQKQNYQSDRLSDYSKDQNETLSYCSNATDDEYYREQEDRQDEYYREQEENDDYYFEQEEDGYDYGYDD